MFGRVDHGRKTGRPLLAGIGLLLMAMSFAWLQLLSPISRPQVDTRAPATEGPFALVVLDPGHGGQDSGTMKAGLLEKEIALDVARPAAAGVETYYATHQISNSTRVASWLPFLQRTSLESANAESQSLAAFIQEALVSRTQAVDRGTTPQQFFVLANVRHPAVLVEGGFLTNADEISKLAISDYREQIAVAISDGVMRYREVLQQQRTPLVVNLPGTQ